jgi:hydrogenase maturation protease
MTSEGEAGGTLILGVGNLLMGDEGVGVEVVRRLQEGALPEGVTCLDGGTGSFQLLDPMHRADRIILIDATVDGGTPGTVRKLRPRFSPDYPPTLTAHDIGLKDLLDTFYLIGHRAEVVLFAVSIAPLQDMRIGLSREIAEHLDDIAQSVLDEVREYRDAEVGVT